MAYTATYAVGDLDDIFIDVIGGIVAGIGGQALVVGGGIAVAIVVAVYTGLFDKIMSFVRKMLGFAKKN